MLPEDLYTYKIQPTKHAIGQAEHTTPNEQHEPDHTDHTDLGDDPSDNVNYFIVPGNKR